MKKLFFGIAFVAICSCILISCDKKGQNEPTTDDPTPSYEDPKCGENLHWSYDENTYTLDITGSGAMFDYDTVGPWGKPAELLGYYEDGAMAGMPIYRYRTIKQINLPEGLTHIGNRAFAFDASGEITNIIIPNSVVSIGEFAFCGCTNLSDITIGSDCARIGENAFGANYALQRIICYATFPPVWATNAYWGNKDIPVYVPLGSVDAYKSAVGWRDFIIQAIP